MRNDGGAAQQVPARAARGARSLIARGGWAAVPAIMVLACNVVGVIYMDEEAGDRRRRRRDPASRRRRAQAEARSGSAGTGSSRLTCGPNAIEYATAGDGPAVLVLHGAPGGFDQTMVTLGALADRGVRLIAPSRPGYLRTPLDAGRTPAQQADAMVRLLDHLGVRSAVVVGLSAGGPTALDLARRHRDRVDALVMLAAVTHRYPAPGSWLSRRLLLSRLAGWLARRLHALTPAASTRLFVRALSTLRGEALDQLARVIVDDSRQLAVLTGLVGTLTALPRRRPGVLNDVEQLAGLALDPVATPGCPLLIVHARADATVPFHHAEVLARAVPGSELLAVEGGSHLVNLGPAFPFVGERVLAFIQDHARAEARGTSASYGPGGSTALVPLLGAL